MGGHADRPGSSEAAVGYSLVLLGTPLVRRIEPGGREVEVVWRLRKALQAVAFLATRPDRRSHKDELIEAVWPEASAEDVRKSFHPTLTDARRTLAAERADRGRLILFNQGVYLLGPELDWQVDVERFRQGLAAGRALREASPEKALQVWNAAWSLYRGPFLAGHEASWIASIRDSARDDYLVLLGELGGLAADLDRVTEALDAYRSLLFEEPYEEHVHMRVMELYARQGRRDLVRKQFVRLQDHLKELGVEPLEETQSCYHRLMR